MSTRTRKAPAKINLCLDITGRRPDGYHEVRMIMTELRIFDTVTAEWKTDPGFFLSCSDPGIPTDRRNLMIRAAEEMFGEYGLYGGLSLRLEKRIPAAAGLGGGSSDAAAVIRLIDELYELELPAEEMRRIGLRIGADVPYFIMGGTALSEGIGEILTPLPSCPKIGILLVKPEEGASTAAVYGAYDSLENPLHPPVDRGIEALRRQDPKLLSESCGNSLEAVTAGMIPVISLIEQEMRRTGAACACMSGSGPTVFGIYPTLSKAEDAEREIKDCFPGFYTAATEPAGY